MSFVVTKVKNNDLAKKLLKAYKKLSKSGQKEISISVLIREFFNATGTMGYTADFMYL